MESKGEILIYNSGNDINLEVKLEEESVWLTINQMCALFERDKSVISRHISKIYKQKELDQTSTVAKYATVQIEGNRQIERNLEYYNLDMIISVGYRVNSKRGTQFRIWANKILKAYLVKGYVLNEKRLIETKEKLNEVTKNLKLLGTIVKKQKFSEDENLAFLNLISDYAFALEMLDKYDHQKIEDIKSKRKSSTKIEINEIIQAIARLKKETKASSLFAQPKDNSFESSIVSIYQTYDGKELYSSIEDKASNLLYFVVKNHSFIDGNKRIGAFLFVYFLSRNNFLLNKKGNRRISNETLVALTIMIAESNPKEKTLIINLIKHLLKNTEE